jgi:hypothetical protein
MSTDPYEQEDGLTSGLKLWADVGLKIGQKVDQMAHQHADLMAKLERNTPVFYTFAASGVFTTGTPLYLQLGSPDTGTFWEIRGWSVGGTDYHVTAAGKSGLYVTAYAADAGAGMSNVYDFSLTLPYSQRYSSEQIIVKANENVMASIQSGTNGQVYVSNIRVLVWPEDAGMGDAILAV